MSAVAVRPRELAAGQPIVFIGNHCSKRLRPFGSSADFAEVSEFAAFTFFAQ